jgi:hypothetical protein
MTGGPMMNEAPVLVAVIEAKKDGQNSAIRFAASDNRSYALTFSPSASGQTIKALQDISDPKKADEILTLTPVRSWSVLRPDNRQAIAFHTREWGTIAIELPDGAVETLQRQLADIQATSRPTSKN